MAVGSNDVLTSNDGGSTWSSQTVAKSSTSLLGVDCQGSLCVAGGEDAQPILGDTGVLYVSNDTGATWSQSTVPNNILGITAVACPSATTCIAVGSGVVVTHDGGQSWNEVSVAGGIDQLFSISCSSGTTCVAVGSNPDGEVNPALAGEAVETTDGGSTFSDIALPAGSASVFEVSCAAANACDAAGATGTGDSAPVFLTSSDGGTTWANATAPPNFTAVAGLSCVGGGSCVAVGHTASGATKTAAAVLPDQGSPSATWSTSPTPVTASTAG